MIAENTIPYRLVATPAVRPGLFAAARALVARAFPAASRRTLKVRAGAAFGGHLAQAASDEQDCWGSIARGL